MWDRLLVCCIGFRAKSRSAARAHLPMCDCCKAYLFDIDEDDDEDLRFTPSSSGRGLSPSDAVRRKEQLEEMRNAGSQQILHLDDDTPS